jgi:FOG: Ankyrin repeat
MKKFLSFLIFLVKTILVLFLIGIILFLLLIFGVEIHDFYYKHFSTAAKIKAYLKANDFEKLKKLNLKEGINAYYNHYTPLYYAVEANNVEAVKYFIEKGADINLPSAKCDTPGSFVLDCSYSFSNADYWRIVIAYDNKEIAKLLKSAGAEYDIFSAIMMQDLPAIKTLIKNGENINKEISSRPLPINTEFYEHFYRYGITPLFYAEQVGNPEIIELLKSAGAK